MKKILIIASIAFLSTIAQAENSTDVSMAVENTKEATTKITQSV